MKSAMLVLCIALAGLLAADPSRAEPATASQRAMDAATAPATCSRLAAEIERIGTARESAVRQDADAWKTVLPFVVIARKAGAKSAISDADKQLASLHEEAARQGCESIGPLRVGAAASAAAR